MSSKSLPIGQIRKMFGKENFFHQGKYVHLNHLGECLTSIFIQSKSSDERAWQQSGSNTAYPVRKKYSNELKLIQFLKNKWHVNNYRLAYCDEIGSVMILMWVVLAMMGPKTRTYRLLEDSIFTPPPPAILKRGKFKFSTRWLLVVTQTHMWKKEIS